MQSIGERLEEARKRKGISIREAAEATKIRGDYLHKFESNQFDIKLPEIYVRGFLRTYANYLKTPADKIVSDYNALGLGESSKASRNLNREVYGRLDLSVSCTKEEKEKKE
jgi:cytoskeletal protein RodZ